MTVNRVVYNKYDRILVLLVLSLFMGGIGGAFQAPRILAILFLPFLFGKTKSCKCIKNILVFFVFFILYCIFSLLWTPDRTEGLKEIVYYVVHFILFVEVVVFSKYAKAPLLSISEGWAFVTFFLSLIVVWELATGNHLSMAREVDMTMNVGGVISDRLTVSATYGNYNGYVTFLCFAVPFVFYFFLVTESILNRCVCIFSLLCSFVGILINGSRGGLFCLIIFATVYILLVPKSKKTLFRSFIFGAIFVAILYRYSDEILLVISLKSESSEGLSSDTGRIEIWKTALECLLRTGGVGVGVGGMIPALEMSSKDIIPIAHNIFIETILQYGLIISFIFFGFLLNLFRKGLKLIDRNRKMAGTMSLLALPIYGIINSIYLLGPDLYILLGTVYVFVYFEKITAKSYCLENGKK